MTDVKKTNLYRSLKPCIRKEDHAELARMLQMVWEVGDECWLADHTELSGAFVWAGTPQGRAYWQALAERLGRAGFGEVA